MTAKKYSGKDVHLNSAVWVMPGQYVGRLSGKWQDAPRYGVLAISIAPQGTVWIGGGFGCLAITGNHIAEYSTFSIARYVRFKNQLWARTQGGGGGIVADIGGAPHPIDLPFQPGFAIRRAPDGTLWLNCYKTPGLWRTEDGYRWEKLPFTDDHIIHDFDFDQMGGIWLVVDNQPYLIHWQVTQSQSIALPDHRYAQSTDISFFHREADDMLWLGTKRAGLWRWNGKIWSQIPRAKSIEHTGILGHTIMTMCMDGTAQQWVATNRGMSAKHDDQWHSIVLAPNSINENGMVPIVPTNYCINALTLDLQGRLWCGSTYGDIFWFDTHQQPYQIDAQKLLPLFEPQFISLSTL